MKYVILSLMIFGSFQAFSEDYNIIDYQEEYGAITWNFFSGLGVDVSWDELSDDARLAWMMLITRAQEDNQKSQQEVSERYLRPQEYGSITWNVFSGLGVDVSWDKLSDDARLRWMTLITRVQGDNQKSQQEVSERYLRRIEYLKWVEEAND